MIEKKSLEGKKINLNSLKVKTSINGYLSRKTSLIHCDNYFFLFID